MSTIPGNPKDYNPKLPGVRRIMREAFELRESTYQYYAQPLEENIYEWHFTIRGPDETDFQGGVYHGRIMLPNDYPMKPPNFIFLTANGRFDTNRKICLNISGFHPESWQPCWSIRTVLLAIISYLPVPYDGSVGSVNYPSAERKKLAITSRDFSCDTCACGGKKIVDLLKPEPVQDEFHNSQWYKDFQVYIQNLSAEHSNNPQAEPQQNAPANNEPSSETNSSQVPNHVPETTLQKPSPDVEVKPKVILPPTSQSVPQPSRAVPEVVPERTYRPYNSFIEALRGPAGEVIVWVCFGLALAIIARRLILTYYGVE